MTKKISMKDEIRNYVKMHNNLVTSREVITYILEEKKIKITERSIRRTLSEVLKETGGKLKPYGLKTEVRNYVKMHNNSVTSQEVITYILEEKKIKITEGRIRHALSEVLKETGGKLKPYGLKTEVRNYVKMHNNSVTSREVITYILKEKKIKIAKQSIRCTLSEVLKETGGELKPYGLKTEIINYVKMHNNSVTSREVITYILEEKKIKTTKQSIRCTLRGILKETGGTLIKYNCN